MSYFLGFFQYISDMGATVMMPIIICIMGCIERMRGGCFENGRRMPQQSIC